MGNTFHITKVWSAFWLYVLLWQAAAKKKKKKKKKKKLFSEPPQQQHEQDRQRSLRTCSGTYGSFWSHHRKHS